LWGKAQRTDEALEAWLAKRASASARAEKLTVA
jgi:hypothetical protein